MMVRRFGLEKVSKVQRGRMTVSALVAMET